MLVEREAGIDTWYQSFRDTVLAPLSSDANLWIAWMDGKWLGPIVQVHLSWLEGWMGIPTPRSLSAEEIERKVKATYRAQYELVRRVTPEERLLEYRLGGGWGPLCRFLGMPVPMDEEGREREFPWVNEKEAMRVKIEGVVRQGLLNVLYEVGRWGVLVGVVVLGWAWVRFRIENPGVE